VSICDGSRTEPDAYLAKLHGAAILTGWNIIRNVRIRMNKMFKQNVHTNIKVCTYIRIFVLLTGEPSQLLPACTARHRTYMIRYLVLRDLSMSHEVFHRIRLKTLSSAITGFSRPHLGCRQCESYRNRNVRCLGSAYRMPRNDLAILQQVKWHRMTQSGKP
jgi:hypothetical protein